MAMVGELVSVGGTEWDKMSGCWTWRTGGPMVAELVQLWAAPSDLNKGRGWLW
jgi:hypothetical protein